MSLMDSIKNIIASGAKNAMSDSEIIQNEYLIFNSSIQRRWMLVGERYYTGNNDVKYKGELSTSLVGAGFDTEVDFALNKTEDGRANNKLAHSYMKLLVDEKVNYLLSRPYSLLCDNTQFLNAVKKSLGKHFGYKLTRLGYEASNKGVGWMHPYIDMAGQLKFMVVPSEQCCPIWTSNAHDELQAMIRYYNVTEYNGYEPKEVTKLEYWTPNGLEFYVVNDNKLIYDTDAYLKYGVDRGGEVPHYSKNNQGRFWGMVPFIPFKNNRDEFPDVRYIKGLIDNYDDSRTEVANFVQDIKNLIYILKGYGGENLTDFMNDLRKFRAVKLDADDAAGINTVNPTMDISAVKYHYEQLSQDIEKFGQSIPKDIEKLGNNPSGTALRFHYSGIDLKSNAIESEFKFGFESLLYFVRLYLFESGQGAFNDIDCDIVFNRDVAINTEAMIKNCVDSQVLLSQKTILANHPFVSDVDAELKRLSKQQQEKEAAAPQMLDMNALMQHMQDAQTKGELTPESMLTLIKGMMGQNQSMEPKSK